MKRRPVVEVEVLWRPESPNRSIRSAHWAVRKKRHDEAHGAFALAVAGQTPPPLPVVVELVRVSVSKLDDDNAIAALKPLRDACAEWLGCRNDRDPRVTWRTAQAHDAEKELLPVGRRGQTRNAFRCYAVVRIWPDPANTSPAPKPPKPPRPSRAGRKASHAPALEIAMLMKIRGLLEQGHELFASDCMSGDDEREPDTFDRLVKCGAIQVLDEDNGEQRVVEALEPEVRHALPQPSVPPSSEGYGRRHRYWRDPPAGGRPDEQVKAAIRAGKSLEEVQTLAKSLGMPPILVSCAKIDWEQHNRPKPPEPVCAAPAPPPAARQSIPVADEGDWDARLRLNDHRLPGDLRQQDQPRWEGCNLVVDRAFERMSRGHDVVFRIHCGRAQADAIVPNLESDGLEAWWDGTLVRVACPEKRLASLCGEIQAAGFRVDVSQRLRE